MTTTALSRIVPFYIYAVVFSSLSIVIGLIWDISWHTSIGRDGLFSPPHLLIYLGAVTAGLFSGYHVLRLTFSGREAERDVSIRFWGIFYGSLGALFCIWGAFTMITSAPFDDWWHNTFGLDVQILSPPHTVLLLGMVTVQFGAMVSVLAYQNRLATSSYAVIKTLKWSFTLSSGFMLVMIYTIASQYLGRHAMHSSFFYIVSGLLFPLPLVAVSVASPGRWAATQTAIVYMIVMASLVWILPLFAAEPRLGPVLNHITHYQSFDFPLLLIFPAIAIDWLNERMQHKKAFFKALFLGPLLVIVMLAIQWSMGSFLMSPYARNWAFGTTSWYFGSDPNWEYRYAFAPWNEEPLPVFIKGIFVAFLIASASAWLGLIWGKWMKSVKR
ncbi:hypothetical protein [Pedobacter sp. JCM 36344]|uniref:hypothetical protein n=1 Tax=Pedobacter sp. JCM 36344 TaxID=3374280 RepID=UPI003979BDFA